MELIEILLMIIIILVFVLVLVVYLIVRERELLSKQLLLNKILHLAFQAGQASSWEYNEGTKKYTIHENIWESLGLDASKTISVPTTRDEFLAMVHPDDKELLWNNANNAGNLTEGTKEYRINPFMYEVRWIWIRDYFTSVEVKSTHGKRHWIGYVQNITEEKKQRIEMELKEEQFSSLFKVAPLGIALFDKTGTLTSVNDKARDIFGAPTIWQKLEHINLFTSTYFKEEQKRQLKQNHSVQVIVNYNFDEIRKQKRFDTILSGTKKLQMTVMPNTWHKQSKILGYYMIIQDVSPDQSFVDSYKQMLSFTKSALWNYIPSEDCFIGDEQYSLISGVSLSEEGEVRLPFEKALEVVHPDDRESFIRSLKKGLDQNNGTHNYYHQFRILKNGRVRYIDNYIYQEIADGKMVVCKGISQDVTTRMLYEEAIQRITSKASSFTGEQYIRVMIRGFIELIGAKGGGVFQFGKKQDPNPKFYIYSSVHKEWQKQKTECIEQLEKLFCDMAASMQSKQNFIPVSSLVGCLKEQLGKKKIKTLVYQKITSSSEELLGYFVIMFETEIVSIDSLQNALSLFTNKIADEFEHLQTIEELKKAALKADEASRAKEVFLSTVSHELRTPLNSILGFTSLLQKEPGLSMRAQKYLHTIHQSSKALDTILGNILSVAKSSSDNVELHLESTNLSALIKDIHNLFALPIQEKGLEFTESIAEKCPLLYLDKTRFQQVLMNLVGNAVRYTEKGTIEITIKTAPPILDASILESGNCDPGAYTGLYVTVSDTGIGIPENQLDTIFDPFKQANNHQINQKGMGLGLSISKKLASDMNATLAVESTEGDGSTFVLYFPRLQKDLGEGDEYFSNFGTSQLSPKMDSAVSKNFTMEERIQEFSHRFGPSLRSLRRGLRLSLINPLAENMLQFANEYQWEELYNQTSRLQKAVYLLNLEEVEDYLHYFRSILVIREDTVETRGGE